jgi:hypothetical protein
VGFFVCGGMGRLLFNTPHIPNTVSDMLKKTFTLLISFDCVEINNVNVFFNISETVLGIWGVLNNNLPITPQTKNPTNVGLDVV